MMGNLEIFDFFVKNGADIHAQDGMGKNAFLLAATSNSPDLIKYDNFYIKILLTHFSLING